MDRQREFERTAAGYHAEVRRLDTGAIVGHLADISLGGAMLITETPLATGTKFGLAVELPRAARVAENVTVEAVVCWCEADLVPGLFSVGIAFCGEGPDAAASHHLLRRVLGENQ